MKHTITIEDMDCDYKIRIAGSHNCKGSNKTIDLYINPAKSRTWFVLTEHKKEIMKGPFLEGAINLYNELD